MMQVFDNDSYQAFVGNTFYTETHEWGNEWRFSITRQKLEEFKEVFRDTIYYHHSSFNLYDDIVKLGFIASGQALKKRNSGNPAYHNTRMGNLGEVLGSHFVKTYLGYQSTFTFPKRLNTNVEQAMKGVDVLGFMTKDLPAKLLIGEVKTGANFYKAAIEDAYEESSKRKKSELPKMLHFAKEYFVLQDDKAEIANIERHMVKEIRKSHLLLSITDSNPKHPFEDIPHYQEKYGDIEEILAVHIQIDGLTDLMPELFL
jgi:hypothetical protein